MALLKPTKADTNSLLHTHGVVSRHMSLARLAESRKQLSSNLFVEYADVAGFNSRLGS